MQVSRISGSLMNNTNRVNNHNVSFNGHFRSVEVEKFNNDVFVARVAGSKTGIEYFSDPNNAVFTTIHKAKDFIQNSTVKRLNEITMDKSDRLGVAEVYYADEGEKVDFKTIKKFADYVVYAPGAKNT